MQNSLIVAKISSGIECENFFSLFAYDCLLMTVCQWLFANDGLLMTVCYWLFAYDCLLMTIC